MEKNDITQNLVEAVRQNIGSLSLEEVLELQKNPDILVESVFSAFKTVCKEKGIEYERTAMYQEELRYRKSLEE
ncbi:MAG: hypothetical protein U0L62_07380 [Paludibacteraceae bacterium]|nr:hypothetical protein [Paludibacteraceae bacterium]